MLTKDSLKDFNNDSAKYADKNGNIVDVPDEWWETEEGRKKLDDMGIKRENIILF